MGQIQQSITTAVGSVGIGRIANQELENLKGQVGDLTKQKNDLNEYMELNSELISDLMNPQMAVGNVDVGGFTTAQAAQQLSAGTNYDFATTKPTQVETTVVLEGQVIAKQTAPYMEKELNKQQIFNTLYFKFT